MGQRALLNMKSTPVAAMAATVFKFTLPEASRGMWPAVMRTASAICVRGDIVQQDAIHRQLQCVAELRQGGHLHLDGPMARVALAHALHGRRQAANGGNVVILNHRHIVEAKAMILPAAQPHRPLIQKAQAGYVLRVSRITARVPATAST